MPYFRELNLLFIHIPKTGGTSIEFHLKEQTTMELYRRAKGNEMLTDPADRLASLQHQPYLTLKKYAKLLSIPFDDPKLRIFTVVRNPYHRIVSDLFWLNKINKESSPEMVFNVIKSYINSNNHDNHNLPQYKFVTDNDGNLVNDIHIMRTETLNNDLIAYGITDFDKRYYVGKESKSKYIDYLNADSINLINKHYKKDFELFGYSTI
jgi:hypothetical protein